MDLSIYMFFENRHDKCLKNSEMTQVHKRRIRTYVAGATFISLGNTLFYFVFLVLVSIHPHRPADTMQDIQKTCVSPQWDLEVRTETPGGISVAFLAQAMSCPGSWAELVCRHLN